jgi:hypothetical protein
MRRSTYCHIQGEYEDDCLIDFVIYPAEAPSHDCPGSVSAEVEIEACWVAGVERVAEMTDRELAQLEHQLLDEVDE